MISDVVLVALITGVVTLVSNLIANKAQLAVIVSRLDELTREVRLHNNFAQRVPQLETHYEYLQKEINEIKKGA